jgi:hypothetical protein
LVHVTFTTRRETCPPVHINSVQLPQQEDIKYLGLHTNRRLTWRKHIHKTEATGNDAHQNALATWIEVKTLHKQQDSHIQSNTQSNLDLQNTTVGVWLPSQTQKSLNAFYPKISALLWAHLGTCRMRFSEPFS